MSIAADPNTGGYWLTTSNGQRYNFHAPFYGSTATTALPRRWSASPPTPAPAGTADDLERILLRLNRNTDPPSTGNVAIGNGGNTYYLLTTSAAGRRSATQTHRQHPKFLAAGQRADHIDSVGVRLNPVSEQRRQGAKARAECRQRLLWRWGYALQP